MKLYIDPVNNEVYAYESDGTQDEFIPESFIPATSARPSDYHEPVVENDVHTGWYLNEPEPINCTIVTKLALKRELERRGIWQDFRALISSDADLWDEWLIANDLRIDDPMTVTAATAMGWTPEQVQQLFNDIVYGATDAE